MKRNLLSILLCLLLAVLLVLPVSASSELPRIVDNADLLTPEEETVLEEMALSFRDSEKMDAVVLTVNSLGGRSIAAYADDYYDYNSYGYGYDYSGLILVVAMEERELYISTCGEAISRFTDDELDTIINGTSYWLSDGAYYDAFDAFLGMLPLYADENHMEPYHENGYNGNSLPVSAGPRINWLMSILIGIVAAAIAVMLMVNSMKTNRRQYSAGDYVRSDSYHLHMHRDVFLYSNVSKVRRQQNNGSHGGGSSHRSSSGRSHGGRGGRF